METVSDRPQCRVCYKDLPPAWAGLDICVWCNYLQEQAAASRRSFRAPSYRSPLLALQEETDAS